MSDTDLWKLKTLWKIYENFHSESLLFFKFKMGSLSFLIVKDPDAGKGWKQKKSEAEDEMIR